MTLHISFIPILADAVLLILYWLMFKFERDHVDTTLELEVGTYDYDSHPLTPLDKNDWLSPTLTILRTCTTTNPSSLL